MPTDLALAIESTPLVDSHEHLRSEAEWVETPGDILVDLFSNYVPADFLAAGCPGAAVQALTNPGNPDIAARFAAVEPYWQLIRHTGYGEAVSLVGKLFYDLDELDADGLVEANPRAAAYRQPGERLRILRDVGGLHHVQIDNFCWACPPDPAGPEFFLYDLSQCDFCCGTANYANLEQETGVEVKDLASLGDAMAALFSKHARGAIAVKAQHAYTRTLCWSRRDPADAERMLQRQLKGEQLGRAALDVIGDWCWARSIELAIEHNLPYKLHTGYYAGNDRMPVEYIKPGNLCGLLAAYPQARFVLMHASYPYTRELAALAKHYRNVYADCCWAWSMNPYQVSEFVREYLHAAPLNKLFIFGGDTPWPTGAAAYATQTRRWLTKTLQAEIDAGDLTERQAIAVAERVMLKNQLELFDVEGTRAALRS